MKFSLIVPTRGRTDELSRLFASFREQTLQDFEVLLSDQNDDDRLVPVIQASGLGPRLTRIQSSGGASRARNQGLDRAVGEIVCFPDDDCVFPADLLQRVADFFQSRPEYGLLTGRSHAGENEAAVSKFSGEPGEIRKMTIHSQCIEFTIFARADRIRGIRFDEHLGVGSVSPWHSDEGPDFILRLQAAGVRGWYDPAVAIWHPQPITTYGAKDRDRAYRYACGNGYYYRKHAYPLWYFVYYAVRTLVGCLLALAKLNGAKARFYLARFCGMWRGWLSMPAYSHSLRLREAKATARVVTSESRV